jgi:ABC-type Fe3+ transport system substrate-binding protein
MLHHTIRWKAEDHLLNYKPQGFDSIDASFKDPDGAFYGTMVIAMPYMINTEYVSSGDMQAICRLSEIPRTASLFAGIVVLPKNTI